MKPNTALLFAALLATALCPAQAMAQDACMAEAECKHLVESARMLSKAEKYEAALSVYQAAYGQHALPWLLFNIGRMNHRLKRTEQAVISYRRYLSDPTVPEDEPTRARATELLKELEDGRKHPTRSDEGRRSSADKKYLEVAENYLKEKNWREALRSASSHAAFDASPDDALRIVGVAACNLRDLKRAQSAYTALKDAAKTSVRVACEENGIPSYMDKLGAEAPQEYKRTTEAPQKEAPQARPRRSVSPQDAELALLTAWSKFKQNRLPQAMAAAKDAVDGNLLEGWTVFGLASCEIGDLSKANEAYASAPSDGRRQIEEACRAQGIVLDRESHLVPDQGKSAH